MYAPLPHIAILHFTKNLPQNIGNKSSILPPTNRRVVQPVTWRDQADLYQCCINFSRILFGLKLAWKDYIQRHLWEGEMDSSQHKLSHQARACRWELGVVTSAEISPSRRTQRYGMYFFVRISISNGKTKLRSEAYRRVRDGLISQYVS